MCFFKNGQRRVCPGGLPVRQIVVESTEVFLAGGGNLQRRHFRFSLFTSFIEKGETKRERERVETMNTTTLNILSEDI